MAKKRDSDLVNGGGSVIEQALLKTQQRAAEIIADPFPKLAFTLDAQTEKIMDALRKPSHLSRGAIARVILKEVMDSPELFPIAEFCEDTWRKVRSDQTKKARQLLLPREFNLYLRKTSESVLGTENRSELFRILVALYGTVKGVVRQRRIEGIELEVVDVSSTGTPNG